MAAGLTLGKTFSLFATNELEPDLDELALDPAQLLPEWTAADREDLLSRGLFAPATYGLVRFHHRSAQEYLTGCWLAKLIEAERGQGAVTDILFVECHGEPTIPPSLRAATAWLALKRPEFCDPILAREPLTLLTEAIRAPCPSRRA